VNVAIVDEIGYMKEEFWQSNVVTHITKPGTSIIFASSTEGRSGHFFKKLRTQRESDGTTLSYHVFRVDQTCERCKLVGEKWCIHCDDYIPPTHTIESRKEARKTFASEELAARELTTTDADRISGVFDEVVLRNFIDVASRVPMVIGRPVSHVYIALDPSGGGESDSGVAVGYFTGTGSSVTGADVFALTCAGSRNITDSGRHELTALLDCIVKRVSSKFPGAILRFIVESNMSFFAATTCPDILAELVTEHNVRIQYASEITRKGSKLGVWTGSRTPKAVFKDTLSWALRDKVVRLSEGFFSVFPGPGSFDDIRRLYTQLRNYKFDPRSGKYSGKYSTEQDDICMAVQLLVYWATQGATRIVFRPIPGAAHRRPAI
jgi:hypothetical protein